MKKLNEVLRSMQIQYSYGITLYPNPIREMKYGSI